jgi:hypothetical protein
MFCSSIGKKQTYMLFTGTVPRACACLYFSLHWHVNVSPRPRTRRARALMFHAKARGQFTYDILTPGSIFHMVIVDKISCCRQN